MIRNNTDCPYLHDIFDQYCNLFKGYQNCNKSDCKVLEILKENEQLKQQLNESKKIIKDLLWSESHYCEGEEFHNIRSRAENFINNEVEE